MLLHLTPKEPAANAAAAWYDVHAERIADGYESIDARTAHPDLFRLIDGSNGLRVLDVGAGSGRDAAALTAAGHHVTAIDPSARMLQLARTLHPDTTVRWQQDQLPALASVSGPFDIIVLSAVWMHVSPADRDLALARLLELLAPLGSLYATLRAGPADPARNMHRVDASTFERWAAAAGLTYRNLGSRLDLLGRRGIRWRTILVSRPS
jgi:2-polyprenyl-3-methyl-5-hydroxy-6-metoxy-1,4-benzoquinol methylase